MAGLHYLDTSAAVPAFVQEPASERMLAWLDRQAEGAVAISAWATVEFSSALAMKVRKGELTRDTQAAALIEWRLFAQAAHAMDVGRRDFEQAALLCQRHELGLRAGDALHLAVAAGAGCTLVTLDERLAKAAPKLGVAVAAI